MRTFISSIQILDQVKNILTLREWLNAVEGVFSSMAALDEILASIPGLLRTHTPGAVAEWSQIVVNGRLTIPRSSVRYFIGVPISVESGQHIVREIRSRDRLSAGLE